MALELQDGYVCHGQSFGADKSIAGELVFQTGMVGYPESITDPSYRGQILVITFPLVGNYGVPSREKRDSLLNDLPAHFEAKQIHIAGLVVASYAGDEYSHHLATSSLGAWLKAEGVPAITGVDTRALTKRIREEGSMLGRLLMKKSTSTPAFPRVNGAFDSRTVTNGVESDWRGDYEEASWEDPNSKNLVAEGESLISHHYQLNSVIYNLQSPPHPLKSTTQPGPLPLSTHRVAQFGSYVSTLASNTISFGVL
jgi:carbamoyl-phosphate synthase/aspartate carbamoyltransferase